MPVELNWGAEQPRQNLLTMAMDAFDKGQQLGLERQRRSALSRLMQEPPEDAPGPEIGGDGASASESSPPPWQAAVTDPDLARTIASFERDSLVRSHRNHRLAAAVLLEAARLHPDQRAAFLAGQGPALIEAGAPEELVRGYDLTDTSALQTDGAYLSRLADWMEPHLPGAGDGQPASAPGASAEGPAYALPPDAFGP